MPRMALMIDYEFCNGCHTCEVACKQEHGYPVGVGGIQLNEIMTTKPGGELRIDYLPFPTIYCDLCGNRTADGEVPACVKHCQTATMYYGSVTELAGIMEQRSHVAMFTPR